MRMHILSMKGKGSGGVAISWSNNRHFWSLDIMSPLIVMHENCDALATLTRENACLLVLRHADFRPLYFVHA